MAQAATTRHTLNAATRRPRLALAAALILRREASIALVALGLIAYFSLRTDASSARTTPA